jgi:hypothetical protein
MGAKATEQAKAVALNPVALGSGVITVVATVLYVLPSMGVKVPDKVARMSNVAMTLAAALGIRSLVRPA